MKFNTQAKSITVAYEQSKLTEVATTTQLLRTAIAFSFVLCCFYL